MMKLKIEAVFAPKVTFASHQNSVPVLRELKIENEGDQALENLVVEVEATPSVLVPRRWQIDRINQGATAEIRDLDVAINAGFLLELHEAITATVAVKVMNGATELARRDFPLEAIAPNEWGGAAMPELLAAFIMPNDPAVDGLLKDAARVLTRAGKSDRLDGYAGGSASRVWEVTSAIWSAVAGRALTYALPPSSFETCGQKVRPPTVVLSGELATCLDTACLFAAAAEQAGLNPIVVLTKGHAFAGVWLQPEPFNDILIDEAAILRKRVKLQELVVFETTLATQTPPAAFSAALAAADEQLAETVESEFVYAVDIRRARMQRFRPVALRLEPNDVASAAPDAPRVAESLEEAPLLPNFTRPKAEVQSETGADRLRDWRRKLLDLTLRNRLLNISPNKTALKLLCPNPAELEDRLSSGAKIRIVAAPPMDAGGRDADLHKRRTGEQLLKAYAEDALERAEVLSPLAEKDLQAALIELYRKTKSDLQEGGANTLFLAVGFLSWKREPEDVKSYRAPLIMVPVTLERKTARSDVRMALHEDKARFNGTLLEMLRQDFELYDLDPFERELQRDENGVDVPAILAAARAAVRDVRGFEIVEEVMLGSFSFSKYLMWKDLTDRADQLLQNRVVKHLLETPRETFTGDGSIPDPADLDALVDPRALFTPLPADSSQLAAVIASANGCDFVLDGPPGTGKSQTIANIIAHNLALGRKVLFVAEKMAALNVVHSRLEANGLGPFCLELHSSKANKAEVVRQLGRAWDTLAAAPTEAWMRDADRLKRLRDELNTIVALLHAPQPGGVSLHQAIGLVVRDGGAGTPEFNWAADRPVDETVMSAMRDVARRLDLNTANIAGLDRAAFAWIAEDDWSPTWQSGVVETASEAARAARELDAAHADFCASIKIEVGRDADALAGLDGLAQALTAAHGLDLAFAFTPDAQALTASGRSGLLHLARYRKLEAGLSTAYAREACRSVPTADLKQKWTTAAAKFWPLSVLSRGRVRKALAAAGGCAVTPDPGADLPQLARMSEELGTLDQLEPSTSRLPGWASLLTDADKVERALSVADALTSASARLAGSAEQLIATKQALRFVVVEANALLGEAMPLRRTLDRYRRAFADYVARLGAFQATARTPAELSKGADLAATSAALDAVLSARTGLNAWAGWMRVRNLALDLDLLPLVHAVQAKPPGEGATAKAFEVGYAFWLAKVVMGREPALRHFVAAEHEGRIADFRKLDDSLAALSSAAIRAMLSSKIPRRDDKRLGKGYGALRYQLGLKAPRKALRELAAEMGDALTTLTPCLLMSPQSVAQYLPADTALFDLVIFDEASQITPWDAIGAIARGQQLIVAGDPKQMPPTNFFQRNSVTDDDGADSGEPDQESILEQCLSANLPHHRLTWHYRSRHESLIAFSNHRYYDDELITFPAAVTRDSAVSFRKVEGIYAKGKGRTNAEEAKALVEEVLSRLRDPNFVDEQGRRLSLGVITLNSEQQKLVEDLLDRQRQQHPEIEPSFDETLAEPVIVKNLETIQGDERDLILLGVGYGPNVAGASDMSMNFGPLNRDGGWRRWNVAITRARREMVLFASFAPGMIDINRTRARAVKDLRDYQDFAVRGMRALPQADRGSVGGYDSPFEMAVARCLRDRGWEVRTQIGASRFRIDLGIVHPDRPGDYLAGVECDGAAYHSAATARDRDKVRESILRGLGWAIVRVWSTDWWHDRAGALAKLDTRLRELLAASSLRDPVGEGTSSVEPDDGDAPIVAPSPRYPTPTTRSEKIGVVEQTAVFARAFDLAPLAVDARFRRADLSRFEAVLRPDRFHEQDYDPVLRDLAGYIVKAEAPLRDDVLIERIARAHGFQRSGRLIRNRILKLRGRPFLLWADPGGGRFVWPGAGSRDSWSAFRIPASEDDIRQIEDIASEELRAGAALISADDVAWELSRRLGIRRLSSSARTRIDSAIRSSGQIE